MILLLIDFIDCVWCLFVLIGVGCSIVLGIFDYWDVDGQWKCILLVIYQVFMGEVGICQCYWVCSLLGWLCFGLVWFNGIYQVLVVLENYGKLQLLLIQNVDGLYQCVGSYNVIDLYGCLDWVCCMGCECCSGCEDFQQWLLDVNLGWDVLEVGIVFDGDVDLEIDFFMFVVFDCLYCGGLLKLDVVFFGENVLCEWVVVVYDYFQQVDVVLVVGLLLMVYFGFCFVQVVVKVGVLVVVLNRGCI